MKSLQNTKTPIIYQIFISGCSWSKSEKLETSEIRKNILDVKKYAQNLAKEFGSGVGTGIQVPIPNFWDWDRFFRILGLGLGLGSIFRNFGIGIDFFQNFGIGIEFKNFWDWDLDSLFSNVGLGLGSGFIFSKAGIGIGILLPTPGLDRVRRNSK